ncbi:hypothetical protein [Corynebacterium suranareeae]|uniref:hypothetical protein n=1 Tax=Corynebacterium suranareeae TaxID=2506452 RepID=UPI000BBA444F|nr:hypothetical protein [Corynebacterium suranareeae]
MSTLPAVFQSELFPEVSGVKEFRGLTYVFFDQFTLPTATQLEQATDAGWSLITWGWWNTDTDLEDVDLEDITFEDDSWPKLSESSKTESLSSFDLNFDGLSDGEREPQPIESVDSLDEIFAEEGDWGLVAISCPNWQVPAACEWLGCMNVGEPFEMAHVLKAWQDGWGVQALAFGGEEDDADLLLRVPEENEELLEAFAIASDQVITYNHEELGSLASLWFD